MSVGIKGNRYIHPHAEPLPEAQRIEMGETFYPFFEDDTIYELITPHAHKIHVTVNMENQRPDTKKPRPRPAAVNEAMHFPLGFPEDKDPGEYVGSILDISALPTGFAHEDEISLAGQKAINDHYKYKLQMPKPFQITPENEIILRPHADLSIIDNVYRVFVAAVTRAKLFVEIDIPEVSDASGLRGSSFVSKTTYLRNAQRVVCFDGFVPKHSISENPGSALYIPPINPGLLLTGMRLYWNEQGGENTYKWNMPLFDANGLSSDITGNETE